MSSSASPGARSGPPLHVAILAGAVAGSIEPLVSFPFEYLKTAQQLHGAPTAATAVVAGAKGGARHGPLYVAREILQAPGARGWRSLYRGVGVVSTGGAAKAVVRFTTYDRVKNALKTPDGSLSGPSSLAAGLCAGVAEALFVVIPSETIKTRVVQSSLPGAQTPYGNGSFAVARELWAQSGFRGIYAGAWATLARQGTNAAVRFGSYSTLRNLVQGSTRPGQKLPGGVTFSIGAASGVATVYLSMPFDVVKTRMQSLQARSRYRNSFWCAIHTAQEEGVRALWRGSTMRLARMSLSGGIVFTVYEEITSLTEGL